MAQIELPVFDPPPPPPVPSSLVVRYGYLRLLGEFAYDGAERPTCGRKVVVRTSRGTELAELLTTTCPNTGCAKALPRQKVTEYLAASGGKEYPFTTEGKVLRQATPEDLAEQARLDAQKWEYLAAGRQLTEEAQLPMKLVDLELLLGGEMAIFYFASEHRVDFRNLVKQLAARFHTRVMMHQVGARDEARLVADFETCGQHCCCKQFLKFLRPVSMGAAKMQKATLDPSKISGRCGRLKCCLRYEEQTYEQLRKNLPRVGTRVRILEGPGIVEETMILTQLVRISLDSGKWIVSPLDEILERDLPAAREGERASARERPPRRSDRPARREGNGDDANRRPPARPLGPTMAAPPAAVEEDEAADDASQTPATIDAPAPPDTSDPSASQPPTDAERPPTGARPGVSVPGRRRRRRRGRGGGGRGGDGNAGNPGPAPAPM